MKKREKVTKVEKKREIGYEAKKKKKACRQ